MSEKRASKRRRGTLQVSGTDRKRDENLDSGDIPEPTLEQFARAVARRGLEPVPRKQQVTLRLDADVLDWFRVQGRGYQTRINALLRAYMEAHRSR